MLAAADEKEAALDTWIEERLNDIVQISGPPDVGEKAATLIAAPPASEAARSAHAVLLRELEPHLAGLNHPFLELFVLEPESGKVMASTSPAQEGKFKRGYPYFDKGKQGLYLQAPYHSADLAGPAMTAAIPLRASDGRVVAVLATRLDLAAINTIVQRRTGLRQTEDSFSLQCRTVPGHPATLHPRAGRAASPSSTPTPSGAAPRVTAGWPWRRTIAAFPRLRSSAGAPSTSSV